MPRAGSGSRIRGGARLSRFLPDARLDRSIAFPAANITSCAFAGEKLDRLFVTSASLDDATGQHAGALFEVDAGVCGDAGAGVRRMTMIGIDWGTTNLRAWRFAGNGSVAEMRRGATGIGAMQGRDFARLLHSKIGDWLDGDVRVILGGMIGSRNGWREIPYLACPASPGALAAGTLPVALEGASARDRAGVALPDGGRRARRDARRGGAIAGRGDRRRHCRASRNAQQMGAGRRRRDHRLSHLHDWRAVRAARPAQLSGAVDRRRSARRGGVCEGVDRALADPAITSLLFTVRTEGLFDEIVPTALADYLSGLLIGAEVARGIHGEDGPITIIAEAALADRYAAAFARAGIADTKKIDGNDAAAAGLWAIGTMTD